MDLRSARCLVVLSLALPLGCQSAPLPAYPNLSAADALNVLSRRAAAIHTFSARCQLILVRAGNQTVQLDGLMVMAPPDRLRLRVWKFDQAVFDLTLLPGALWIETPRDAESRGPILPAALNAAQLARFLTWFQGGFFTAPGLKTQSADQGTLSYRLDQSDGTTILCDVDRATATPRKFTLIDAGGATRFSLAMLDYHDISGIAWPTRLIAVAADSAGGAGEIDIAFSEIEFNAELAPQAFVPPRNAEKRP